MKKTARKHNLSFLFVVRWCRHVVRWFWWLLWSIELHIVGSIYFFLGWCPGRAHPDTFAPSRKRRSDFSAFEPFFKPTQHFCLNPSDPVRPEVYP
jgi:hypothetical protein